jgi:outer membrane receptor protein involved in Fe transport
MADVPLTERFRFVGGARVEYSDQAVITRDLFDPTLPSIRSTLENTDVLPGINLVYSLGTGTNLRLALSQTVNRPEFRELAPFEFTDIVGGRSVVGNPDLERALIRNADLRWEWFPADGAGDGEVFAISGFYKDFEKPIEKVVEATAAFRTSFANAKGARNYGLEVEARKALGRAVLIGVNYTYVSSEIELERGAAQIQTNLDRPLAGQSKNVVNGMVELRSARGDLSARVLVNWFGDRISEVGALGIPDIYEQGRTGVDVVLTKRLGDYTFRLSGDNLTDAENLFTQGGEFQRGFKVGRSISLGLSYSR